MRWCVFRMNPPVTGVACWCPPPVVAIVALALVVRFMHLTALGFNSDEAVYSGQAGSLAGVGAFARSFSPFRAHPLLLQTTLALEYLALGHMSEYASRATVALLGVVTVFATYRVGRRMYGVPVGLAAALGLAIMPYHVFISRQVLLDVPAGLFVLLAFAALYRYDGVETRRWLYLAGALAGVACVIKETMVVFLPAAVLYLFWEKLLRKIRLRDGFVALVLMGMMLAPFVSTRFVFSGSSAGGYIIYQLFRAPNHPIWYFPVVFWIFITPIATCWRSSAGSSSRACGASAPTSCSCRGSRSSGCSSSSGRRSCCPTRSSSTPAMAMLAARGRRRAGSRGARPILGAIRRDRRPWSPPPRSWCRWSIRPARRRCHPRQQFHGTVDHRRRGAGLRRRPRGGHLARESTRRATPSCSRWAPRSATW